MGFLSFKFILFIGMTFFLYFVFPKRFQWIVLLACSYLYYYLNSGLLVGVLFGVSVFTFLAGKVLFALNEKIDLAEDKEQKNKLKKNRKMILILSIVVVLSNLIIIKYSDFLISNINSLINGHFDLFHFILPIGISFYTLQAISYLVDITKNKCSKDDNILHFLLYMSYFPQIIQGPIPRYNKLAHQLIEKHEYDYVRVTHGLQLMLYGIAKKVIIADRIASPVRYIFDNYSDFHGLFIVFGAICYSIQIYADFSGGIDAIKGISEVFGIKMDDNFRQPYFSRSIEEFWRRWHISLGSWMKDYVFYPLSLSKAFNSLGKKVRQKYNASLGKKIAPCLAMFIVYLLVGIWHGASWKYVAYGIWNGIFISSGILLDGWYKNVLQKCKISDDSKWFNCFRMVRTFLICSIGRLFSRANDLPSALAMFGSIFKGFFDFSFLNSEVFEALGLNYKNWILLIVMFAVVMYIDYLKEKGVNVREKISKQNIFFRWVLYYILIMSIMVFGLYGGSYDASSFIYGKF